MTSEPSNPIHVEATVSSTPCHRHHSLSWGTVLAGTVTAIGLYLLLSLLGIASGLAPFRAVTDFSPVMLFSTKAAVFWSLFAIIALALGGWVAGRISGCPNGGLVHGVLVWCLAVILALPLLTLGTGLTMARTLRHRAPDPVAERPAAVPAASEVAGSAAKCREVQLISFVTEAVQSIPTNAAPKALTRAEREVGFALRKLFAPVNAAAFGANRLEAINALEVYTVMTPADATITLDGWIASRKNLLAELDKLTLENLSQRVAAEQYDRALANAATQGATDQAMRHLSRSAIWAFFALLVGLYGAAFGGRCGAEYSVCQTGSPGKKGDV